MLLGYGDRSYANKLQKEVVEWYAEFKNGYKDRVAEQISRAIAVAEGVPPSIVFSGGGETGGSSGSCCAEQMAVVASLKEEISALSERVRVLERGGQ